MNPLSWVYQILIADLPLIMSVLNYFIALAFVACVPNLIRRFL